MRLDRGLAEAAEDDLLGCVVLCEKGPRRIDGNLQCVPVARYAKHSIVLAAAVANWLHRVDHKARQ